MFLTNFTVSNFLQLIFYAVVLVGVLIATYYVTKWIANNQKSQMSGRNFETIETLKVTNNKYLQIVRVGNDDYYVIAVGKDEIHMLGKLEKSQLNFSPSSGNGGGFSDILASFKNTISKEDDMKDTGDKNED